ncbi:MAG: GTP-binding protein, partial [Limisphaerales bacterium]
MNSKLKTQNSKLSKPRYMMIGGFLGAGKTTAVAQLANYFSEKGFRVGLITNDQGKNLVDTAMLTSRGFATEEISGGCFCCRFNSLLDAAKKLSAETKPDIFIAEPVGSCTDLVATVTYPLRRIYGENFSIAPLSVLIDPIRAARIFGLESGGNFSDKVVYIYRKQLEEADFIVINKCDLLNAQKINKLREVLAENFSRVMVFEISARCRTGLEKWFEAILSSEQKTFPSMNVNYEIYAEGEALLGWLNATVRLNAKNEFDGNTVLKIIADELQKNLNEAGAEIAHLKMTLDPENVIGDLAVINLVRNDVVPELSQELSDEIQNGLLTVNIRAEIAPEFLRDALTAALKNV